MAVTVLLEIQTQADKVNDMLQLLKEILPDTRAYDGCNGVDVVQNQDDPANMVLVEKWDSKEHHQKYGAWRVETGTMDQLGAMLAGAPSVRYFDDKNA